MQQKKKRKQDALWDPCSIQRYCRGTYHLLVYPMDSTISMLHSAVSTYFTTADPILRCPHHFPLHYIRGITETVRSAVDTVNINISHWGCGSIQFGRFVLIRRNMLPPSSGHKMEARVFLQKVGIHLPHSIITQKTQDESSPVSKPQTSYRSLYYSLECFRVENVWVMCCIKLLLIQVCMLWTRIPPPYVSGWIMPGLTECAQCFTEKCNK
jgi:hypothetical protein